MAIKSHSIATLVIKGYACTSLPRAYSALNTLARVFWQVCTWDRLHCVFPRSDSMTWLPYVAKDGAAAAIWE